MSLPEKLREMAENGYAGPIRQKQIRDAAEVVELAMERLDAESGPIERLLAWEVNNLDDWRERLNEIREVHK